MTNRNRLAAVAALCLTACGPNERDATDDGSAAAANLFDPRIANTGIDWGVDEAMMQGVDKGLHEAAIVVGAWSSSRRFAEYSPRDGAPQYARFLIDELMPRVAAEFRVRTGPDNTFVKGRARVGDQLAWLLAGSVPAVEH